jgi:hypothetical protein
MFPPAKKRGLPHCTASIENPTTLGTPGERPQRKHLRLQKPFGFQKQTQPFSMFVLEKVFILGDVTQRLPRVTRIFLKVLRGSKQSLMLRRKKTGAARQLEGRKPRANTDSNNRYYRRKSHKPDRKVVQHLRSASITRAYQMMLESLGNKVG